MAHHDLVDVAVTLEGGAHQHVGRCRCGWSTEPCSNAVHALALVEDHAARSRQRSRRRPDRTGATARPTAAGPDRTA